MTFPEMSAKAKLLHVVGASHLWESRAESWLAGLLGGAEPDLQAVDIEHSYLGDLLRDH